MRARYRNRALRWGALSWPTPPVASPRQHARALSLSAAGDRSHYFPRAPSRPLPAPHAPNGQDALKAAEHSNSDVRARASRAPLSPRVAPAAGARRRRRRVRRDRRRRPSRACAAGPCGSTRTARGSGPLWMWAAARARLRQSSPRARRRRRRAAAAARRSARWRGTPSAPRARGTLPSAAWRLCACARRASRRRQAGRRGARLLRRGPMQRAGGAATHSRHTYRQVATRRACSANG